MLVHQKARLREFLKQQRRSLTPARRLQLNLAVQARLAPRLEQADTIFCYVSTDLEVDTRGLIDELWQSGRTVLVPKILNREKMIAARFDGWDTLHAGPLGILAPDTDTAWPGEPDLCLTPGLGFSANGKRIGYGRGYYDKWFAAHPGSERVALCYECQLLEDIPVTDTDVRVEKIITEQRVIRCPESRCIQHRA